MKIKFSMSLIALFMVAFVMLGSVVYFFANPNAFPHDERREFQFNKD